VAVGALFLIKTLTSELQAKGDVASRSLADTLVDRALSGGLTPTIAVADGAMAQVVAADGRVVAASANLGNAGPVSDRPLGVRPTLLVLSHIPDDSDLETYRVWARTVDTESGTIRVYAGNSPEQVREAVRALRSFWGCPSRWCCLPRRCGR
jgi:hypothetical protein